MPLNDEKYIPPEDGLNLVLTVDEMIQYIVEKYLAQAIEDNAPVDYASCVVMNPQNGDILAMATAPSYDPNQPFTPSTEELSAKWDTMTSAERTTALQNLWKNRTVTDAFEPGSVFKTVTAAIALEEGITYDVDKVQFNCAGFLNIEGWKMKCWRYYNPHGSQSLRKALMNSCNPAFMGIALSLGKSTYYNYLSALGVAKKTGADLPGEVNGVIHKISDVTDSTLASAAFGQGFTLTQLNMLNTICTLTNGGNLMRPRIVKEIKDKEGNVVQSNEPVVVKQVFSKTTS